MKSNRIVEEIVRFHYLIKKITNSFERCLIRWSNIINFTSRSNTKRDKQKHLYWITQTFERCNISIFKSYYRDVLSWSDIKIHHHTVPPHLLLTVTKGGFTIWVSNYLEQFYNICKSDRYKLFDRKGVNEAYTILLTFNFAKLYIVVFIYLCKYWKNET